MKDILKAFKNKKSKKIVEKLIVAMKQKNLESDWGWIADGSPVLSKVFSKLNADEMEYFEKLLQKYCNIEKITDTKWELTLK